MTKFAIRSTIFTRAIAAIAVGFGAAGAAQALPAFVAKEGKSCAYCHIAPTGAGPRNYRGVYYKEHALSFAGFDDAAEAKKAGVEIGPDPTPAPKSLTPAGKPAEPAPEKPAEPEQPAEPGKEEPTPEQPAEPAKPANGTPVAQGPSTEPKKPVGATPTMTIAQAKANLKAAETAHKKAPKDAAKQRAYAEALAQLGRSTMLDQSIPPMRRYPEALRLYRQALALDPKNKVALADKKQIEDVYKSMGRPVPK